MKWTRSTHSRCHFGIPVLCCGLCRAAKGERGPRMPMECVTHTQTMVQYQCYQTNTHTHTLWHKHTLWCSASDIQTNNCALLVSHRQTIVPYQCHTDKPWCHGVKNKQIRQIFWMWQNLPKKKKKWPEKSITQPSSTQVKEVEVERFSSHSQVNKKTKNSKTQNLK